MGHDIWSQGASSNIFHVLVFDAIFIFQARVWKYQSENG